MKKIKNKLFMNNFLEIILFNFFYLIFFNYKTNKNFINLNKIFHSLFVNIYFINLI